MMRVVTCAIVAVLAVGVMAPMVGCGGKKKVELEVTRETVVSSPTIRSVALEPSGRIDTRERAASVKVTMNGDPDLQATFDVVGRSLGQPMEEVQPGVYVGTIDLDRGFTGELQVVGHLVHPPSGASQQKRSGDSVTLFMSMPPPPVVDACSAEKFDATLGGLTLYYRTDESAVNKKNQELLETKKSVLASHEKCKIWVLGYTDDVGDSKYNYVLSSFRANEVRDLLKTLGIPEGRIVTKYFGETRPAVAGETAEARSKNRRVEIRGVYPY